MVTSQVLYTCGVWGAKARIQVSRRKLYTHFDSSQFSSYNFQFEVNLVSTGNSLTKNDYMANGVHNGQIGAGVANKLILKSFN